MHISFVAALGPDTMVVSALLPVLSYVHSYVSLPDAKDRYDGEEYSFVGGCSQSLLVYSIVAPSLTSVMMDCLCECVPSSQNCAPSGVEHVSLATTPIACGAMEILVL